MIEAFGRLRIVLTTGLKSAVREKLQICGTFAVVSVFMNSIPTHTGVQFWRMFHLRPVRLLTTENFYE
jgi:hypothetical protein